MMPVGSACRGCGSGNALGAVLLVVFLSVFNITGGELVIIAILALIVLGPDKLPDFIRRAGRVYGEIKKMSTGFKTEFRDVIDEPVREMQDTVNLAKSWFDEGRTAIETMDDSKWSTPAADRTAADGAVDNAVTPPGPTTPSQAPSTDAFGAAPSSNGDDVNEVLDDSLSDDAAGDDEDEVFDESDDDPNFYDSSGKMIDLTRVDSFLQIEESSDSFGSVSKRPDTDGPTA